MTGTCPVVDCDNESYSDYEASGNICEEHLYSCRYCGNDQVSLQSLSQRPIFCEQCGWVPDRGGLEYLFDTSQRFGDWDLQISEEDELKFSAPWRGERWMFHCNHDPVVDDWQVYAFKHDGLGMWDPGGVPSWDRAFAYVLEELDIIEDSMVRATEKI